MHKKIIRCSLDLNAKIGVYIIGLKAKSKIAKIGVYIIPAILISFWTIKICVYNMRQNQDTWLQTYDLGDVRVIWCNSLGDSLF